MIQTVRHISAHPINELRPLRKLHRSRQTFDPCEGTLALILAGGRGSRLNPLTNSCSKPAVPFGGNFRIIDFTLSNCINSGLRRVGVLSQYEQQTLIQHLNDGWGFLNRDLNEFIELMPACPREGKSWYQGTADAITQNIHTLKALAPRYTLILAGDHVYKADYRRMIQFHESSGADVTIACTTVPCASARQFGVVTSNRMGKITAFEEKPEHPVPMKDHPDHALASMGIYVFDTSVLISALESDNTAPASTHDFGRDIIPRLISEQIVKAYEYSKSQDENYWRDVGTVDAYFDTNMQLLSSHPVLDLHDVDWPIRTLPAQFPAARLIFDDRKMCGTASDSILAAGCVIRGARVKHAILFSNVRVDESSQIHNALILPGVQIGKRCHIQNAIIDSNARIPDGTVIGFNRIEDSRRYAISDKGIVVVTAKDTHNSKVISPVAHTHVTSASTPSSNSPTRKVT